VKKFSDFFHDSDHAQTHTEVVTFYPIYAQKLENNPDMSKWAEKLHMAAAIFMGTFQRILHKYGVNHRVTSPSHLQTSGQVELSNREVK
jgi:hypothetical protein